jgi:sugar lactone lactonase YvrE
MLTFSHSPPLLFPLPSPSPTPPPPPPPQVLVKEYEGIPLRGPRSLLLDDKRSLFFTDSGPDGDTGLHNRAGSVFVIQGEGASRLLRPLALRCLATPSGLALVTPKKGGSTSVYVCEGAENRVLRYTQRPVGVWHGAVFFTFTGRLGPCALVADAVRGLIYVARPELAEAGRQGVISVLSLSGELLKEFETPGSDVSALVLSPDGSRLYVADSATNTVFSLLL